MAIKLKVSDTKTDKDESEELFKGAEDVLSGANREVLMSDGGSSGRSDNNDCSDF